MRMTQLSALVWAVVSGSACHDARRTIAPPTTEAFADDARGPSEEKNDTTGHAVRTALIFEGQKTRADPWDATALHVESAGLPAVNTSGERVAYLERRTSPAGEEPTVDTALVIEQVGGATQRVVLVGNQEWTATLPVASAPDDDATDQADRAYAQLCALVAERVVIANALLDEEEWHPMRGAEVEEYDVESGRSMVVLGDHRVLLRTSGKVPELVLQSSAGDVLWRQPDSGLLAVHEQRPGWEQCRRDPPYLLQAWAEQRRNTLLVLATQWRSADMCVSSHLYRVHRTTPKWMGDQRR